MTAHHDVSSLAISRARWRISEVAFWILALSCAFLFPSRYLIMTDIVRLALLALSLDLILGYAGIVSLGHAAFFGVGDVAGKYYVPKLGAFVIYTMMIVILILRPNGLFGRTAAR